MRPVSFYLSLRTQYQNLGDFMIAWATVSTLKEIGRVVLDSRSTPEAYVRLFAGLEGVEFTRRDFWWYLVRGGRWVYVVKPGGYAALPGLRPNVVRMAKWLYFRLARLLGARMLMMPHSYSGALQEPRALKRLYFSVFDLVLGRDHRTCDEYRRLGLSNVDYAPDMALALAGSDRLFLATGTHLREGIAVSMRFDRRSTADRVTQLLAQYEGAIRMVSQVEFDDDLNREVGIRLRAGDAAFYDRSQESISAVVEIYSRSRYVVSNRLHALLLGYINGAIPVAVVDPQKDAKIVGCLQALGLGDCVVASDEEFHSLLRRQRGGDAPKSYEMRAGLVKMIAAATSAGVVS